MHYIVKVHTVEFAGEKVQVNGNLKVFALQDSSHTIAHISEDVYKRQVLSISVP